MTKIGSQFEFIAVAQEYEGSSVIVAVNVHALGETVAREELQKQGYTKVVLIGVSQ